MEEMQNICSILFLITAIFGFAVSLKIKQKRAFQIFNIANISVITILIGVVSVHLMDFAGAFFALAPLLGLLILFYPRKFKHKEVYAVSAFVFFAFILFISLILFTENTIKLRFEHAEFLWLILFLPIAVLLWYFSVNIINSWQNYVSLVLRVLLISLLIVAISGIRIVRKHDKLTVIFLIDRSESMPKELSYDWYKNYIKTKENTKKP